MERLTDNTDYCTSWSDCNTPEGKCVYLQNCYDRKIYNKLKEYEDAEEQGLLLRLPCKVDDTIYEVAGYCCDCFKQTDYCHLDCKEPKYRVRHWKVESQSVRKRTIMIHGYNGQSGTFGKTVFLTKSEAEAALERMNSNEKNKKG